MNIIKPGFEILNISHPDVIRSIEEYGRTCYKSQDRITSESSTGFVSRLLSNKHKSVLEHVTITVKFIVDRGVSHELVRHRIASYSQESSRFCNYSKDKFGREITVIKPCFWEEDAREFAIWKQAMQVAESAYMTLMNAKVSPQEARSVLPNSLKTEIVATMNLRIWRKVLRRRTSSKAHPQMREVMVPLLEELKKRIPIVFDNI